jgi:hypothetical protein
MTNCLDINKDIYLKFIEYKPIDYNIQRLLNSNGQDVSIGFDQNEIDVHLMDVVFRSFLEGNLHFWNGFVLGLYRIAGFLSVLYAFSNWQGTSIQDLLI